MLNYESCFPKLSSYLMTDPVKALSRDYSGSIIIDFGGLPLHTNVPLEHRRYRRIDLPPGSWSILDATLLIKLVIYGLGTWISREFPVFA